MAFNAYPSQPDNVVISSQHVAPRDDQQVPNHQELFPMADYATSCQYAEIKTIGKGRFGVVKKVERRRDQKEFACKVITAVPSPHNPSLNDAKHEYEVLRALHHPNIVEYVDFEQTDQEAKIYMELCRGGNLKDWIRARGEGPDSYVPEAAIWSIILQLTSALTYCHFGWNPAGGEMTSSLTPNFRTVLHRDLKPANVLISSTTGPLVVKLGDFGLAKFMDLEHTLSTFAGTRPYLAPEIIDNEATGRVKWSKHADIYSLGCTVYEICTLDLLVNNMEADLQQIPSSYSDRIRGFIGRCLSTEPSHRPDARELFQWASRCYGNRTATPRDMPETLTVNPSIIGLLGQPLLEGVRPLSEFSPSPVVHLPISDEENIWIDSKPFAESLRNTLARPIISKAGMQALSQPGEKNNAATLLQVGGFDLSSHSFSAEDAFSWAIRHGLWDLVGFLMKHGPSIETAVWFRHQCGQQIDRLTQNTLKEYNKVVNVVCSLYGMTNQNGDQALNLCMTPIHHATLQCNQGAMELLINAGARINAPATFSTAPAININALMIATILGDEWMIKKLLEAGADPLLTFGADVLSPLMLAVRMGLSESIVKLLIERGTGSRLAENGIPVSLNAIFWTKEEAIKILLLGCVEPISENPRANDREILLQRVLSDAAGSKHHSILRTLLDWGIAREFQGTQGRSPFLLAAANGDLESMKMLMEKGVEAETTDHNGYTALHLVAICSEEDEIREEAVELLMKAGADVNARDNGQFSPLILSVRYGSLSNEKMVEILLKHGADPRARCEQGITLLMYASMYGNVKVMKMLLQAGVDATSHDKKGRTALYFATMAVSDHEARFTLLQEYGAEITGRVDMEDTVIHNAIRHCTVNAVKQLFNLYPDALDSARHRGGYNMNALDIAAVRRKRDHLEFMLNQAADMDMESKSWVLLHAITGGSTACVSLVISTFTGLASRAFKVPKSEGEMSHVISTPLHAACLTNPEVALLILEHGADVRALDSLGRTPLHNAAFVDNVVVVRELIQRGEEVMSWATEHHLHVERGEVLTDLAACMMTPLHIAATKGATGALEALLAAGTDINEPTHDEYGLTPLHLAVLWGQTSTFNFLISKGADHDKVSKQSQATPLRLALDRGFEGLAVELIYLGVQTCWARPDGFIIAALNIAAEKGLRRVSAALLGKPDGPWHALSVPQIGKGLDNARSSDDWEAEYADILICDRGESLTVVERTSEDPSMIPAAFDKTVMVLVRSRNLDLLQRLADSWELERVRRHGKMIAQISELDSSTIRSGRDGLSEAWQEAASKGLTDYIRPLMGVCGWMVEFKNSEGFLPIHTAASNGHGEFLSRLISETSRGVDQETDDGTHRTALHIAAENGHFGIVETLLLHGADVDRGDEDDWSALHFAALAGELEVVNLLVQRDAALDKKSNANESPIFLAAGSGHLDVVEALLDAGATVDATSREDGWTALINAAMKQNVEVVEALLKAGAKPNQRANDMETPLLKVLSGEGDFDDSEEVVLETVKMLLEYGADVEACDNGDWNALRNAVSCGWTSVVDCLVEHKADIHARDKDGDDALQIAAMDGFRDIAESLLEQGADIGRANNEGHTPLHSAALNGRVSVAELLIQKEAKLDAMQPETGSTPMHIAAQNGHLAVMQVLHFYGADIVSPNNEQMTPLLLAIANGHTEAATFLVQQKVDVNLPHTRTKTVLHFAIDQEDEHFMELLLQHGANPNVFPPTVYNGNKSGMCSKFRNPLHYCVDAGWLDGIQLLLKHNADVTANWLDGGTALHAASTFCDSAAVRLLLENGAKVDIWDGRRAPLHNAAASGDKGIIEMLLEYGADPNEPDLFGLTPLDIAKQEPRCEEVIRVLELVTKTKRSGWKIWKSK